MPKSDDYIRGNFTFEIKENLFLLGRRKQEALSDYLRKIWNVSERRLLKHKILQI